MTFSQALERAVLLLDGAMGTQVQALDLDTDRDFLGHENCTEILNISRPDLIAEIHASYLAAGADAIQTNSFGGSPVTLDEFGIGDRAHEINFKAARIARETAQELAKDGRARFVLGSIGPGTKLPSLGHIGYGEIEAAIAIQAAALIEGDVDALLVETCQDPLQIKAAVNGARRAMARLHQVCPIFVQVTIETTGTMLVGTDIQAAATIVDALDVDGLGLNCATGPKEMAEHLRALCRTWRGPVSVLPNAGLPELRDGRTHYPLGPDELAAWLERFIQEDRVNLIGGCCGTTPDHIRAMDRMLRHLGGDRCRPAPKGQMPEPQPAVTSLFSVQSLRQENAFLSIGERCNANGSKKFRVLQAAEDWDGCVAMARMQVADGSHALDLCTAYVGRDEVADMTNLVGALRGSVDAPLVFDSTELPVLERAVSLYGGKGVINSINFEDGEAPAAARMRLARKFGHAVIALTIDETGMAKTVEDKVGIAERLVDFACGRFGLPPSDLLIDPLTFTICTGNTDDRRLGLWTLEAIAKIAERFPGIQIILGLSNISFGLDPAARHVLNSVMLDMALARGLTGAILHGSKIIAGHKIDARARTVAEDLILDNRRAGYDPLTAFMALFDGRKVTNSKPRPRPKSVTKRLEQRIVDGDRNGLEQDLDEALSVMAPLDIVNTHLLAGMKTVGELFGAGKMQLPFVLQSAETMKRAVRHLEPYMEKSSGDGNGTIVLATVKGDVHDIGKNLVDIILSNNGYNVINLGIKQPLQAIVQAANDHKADAIGMSGLLVKSTVIMRDNLDQMHTSGIRTPVILGGAALTRAFVDDDCVKAYGSAPVAYARDAFDGLSLMASAVKGEIAARLGAERAARKGRTGRKHRTFELMQGEIEPGLEHLEQIKLRRDQLGRGVDVPNPPFWGAAHTEDIAIEALLPYLNESMLYQFHWGYKKAGRTRGEFLAWCRRELQPVLRDLLEQAKTARALRPQAAHGYWKAAGEGNDIVLFDEDGLTEISRFSLPRQNKENGLCIADFLRDVADDERDILGLQIVTIGQKVSEVARDWFAADRYQDYVRLHGLGVELAEALAEYIHGRIRAELGFGHQDARDNCRLIKQGYRGARYSFGYPACPNMEDQAKLLKLLGADRLGLEMSEEDQLHPEQSTSAIVIHHPQAKYFGI